MTNLVKIRTKRKYSTALRQDLAQVTRQRIIDAARRLLVSGTYSSVTMDDIAREAGVAYQTVYAVFGTKLGLAKAMIEAELKVEGVDDLIARARNEADPEAALRTGAEITRRINEPCADLIRFMRESGDPVLLQRHHEMEARRFTDVESVAPTLLSSGRLKPGLSPTEVHDVVWAMFGPDWYIHLVFERGWTPARYEAWLGDALIDLLLEAKPYSGAPSVGAGASG